MLLLLRIESRAVEEMFAASNIINCTAQNSQRSTIKRETTCNSETMGCFETQEGRYKVFGCLAITAVLSLVILLPLSFSYIEYYEYGLEMR